jgi:ATP-dependent Clp protease protease subunit
MDYMTERKLQNNRIVYLGTAIDDNIANDIVTKLLILESENNKKPIHLYINSPGGSVSAGMAIYDTMKYVSCPIYTYCIGMAASMAAFLLSSGDIRFALPNGEVMIHQPHGSSDGQVSDILLKAHRFRKMKDKMIKILAENTQQPISRISRDIDRDNFMSAQEAKEYGLIDEIIWGSKWK